MFHACVQRFDEKIFGGELNRALIRSHVQVERCGLFILGLVDVPACAVRAV